MSVSSSKSGGIRYKPIMGKSVKCDPQKQKKELEQQQ